MVMYKHFILMGYAFDSFIDYYFVDSIFPKSAVFLSFYCLQVDGHWIAFTEETSN